MAFYSSKCDSCTERTKRVVKEIKYKDGNGFYTVKYYNCNNVGCEIVHKTTKNPQKRKQQKNI